MNDLLNRFYEEIILTDKSVVETNFIVDEKVKRIMENYIKGSSDDEHIRDMCFEIVSLAEREGFYLGFKQALKFLVEVLN